MVSSIVPINVSVSGWYLQMLQIVFSMQWYLLIWLSVKAGIGN